MNKVEDKKKDPANKKTGRSIKPLSYDDVAFVRGGSGGGRTCPRRRYRSSSWMRW